MKNKTIEIARKLRKNLSPAEKRLWPRLRDRRFAGFKFRRQHPIGAFVVDFCCPRIALVVELDGESHLERQCEDKAREAFLVSEGMLILRFWNTEVYDDLEPVLEKIYQTCVTRSAPSWPFPSPPTPLPGVPGRGEQETDTLPHERIE